MNHDQALSLLHAWVKSDSLLKHCRSLEIVMRAAAKKYGEPNADVEQWAITGLIHDADYEQWPDDHPTKIVEWLREQGEEELAHAVAYHQTLWNLPSKSMMDKCLLACDELTGFIIACCLVRTDGIATLEPKSVKKKFKTKAFAAKIDREIIKDSVDRLGADFDEHVRFIIEALKPYVEELGIAGSASR